MPISNTYTTTQNVTIPSDIYSMRIRLWGAGGGGEFINSSNFASTAGSSGGSTSYIGLVANGGTGGGIGSKNGGGDGGTVTTPYNWGNLGASITARNGSSGVIFSGGTGGNINGLTRNGGGGSPGQTQYSSYSTHFFNNDTNQHTFTQTSSDLSIQYMNPWAPDGLPCGTISYGKYYKINFYQPFVNANYSISITGICQQAAGGGTNGPYYSGGIADKTANGFSIWFCNGNAKNGYIRCFSFTASGQKQGAAGRGGGGAAALETTITRSMFQSSGTYAPGTTHTLTVGAAGSSGGSSASAGVAGRAELYMIIVPTVNLTANTYAIVLGQSSTLSWNTTGDGDSIAWTSGGLSNSNLTSSQSVSPTETTTYTAVASGLGGNSNPASVTIVVYQPPTAEITTPSELDYGTQGTISYECTYANISITITPYYSYIGLSETAGTPITITPISSSAEKGVVGSTVSGTVSTSIPYTTLGPRSVRYVITANGNGGQFIDESSIQINIDETPDNIIVPETLDAFKDQDPVTSPETDVVSELLAIADIDIPVEVKSNKPIQVDINGQQIWRNLREM